MRPGSGIDNLHAAGVGPDVDGGLLGRLSAAERGAVLGLVVGGVRGGDPLAGAARLAGPEGEACRAALRALGALSREARARCLAALARGVIEAVPAGIERVHPGWLRAALAGEATPILLAVVSGLPAAVVAVASEIVEGRAEDPALRAPAAIPAGPLAELRRALFAPFVAMPDPPPPAPRRGEPEPAWWLVLTALPVDALAAELARRGGETLGLSLQGAGAAIAARAAAGLGAVAARALLAVAARAPVSGGGARPGARVRRRGFGRGFGGGARGRSAAAPRAGRRDCDRGHRRGAGARARRGRARAGAAAAAGSRSGVASC